MFFLDKENAQIDAVRQLRYLDTESATEYLASILGERRRSSSEIETALYASQFPQVAAKRLEQEIQMPDFAPFQSFMITLQVLKAQASALQNGGDLSKAERATIDESVDRELLAAAAVKSPQAKADSYFYLLIVGSKWYRNNTEIRLKLIECLPSVSDFNLYSLLTAFWASIKDSGPALVPALKEVAARPTPSQGFNVSEPALRRLDEIGSPGPAKSR